MTGTYNSNLYEEKAKEIAPVYQLPTPHPQE
jgi:hypothetical protein